MDFSELMIDDFDHANVKKYRSDHSFVKSYKISLSDVKAKKGKQSLQVSYDFGGWTTGNGALIIEFIDAISSDVMPLKLGVWVHSDGKTPWLRATLIDGVGERKTINLTTGNVCWFGWKYLDAQLDCTWKLPIRIERIYAVETDKQYQGDSSYKGVFYLDELRYVFKDNVDLIGPEFTSVMPRRNVVYDNDFTFRTIVRDAKSGVNPNSIKLKINNIEKQHIYCVDTSEVSYHFNNVAEGKYFIEVIAYDNAGNKSIPELVKEIVVDLSPDIEAPILSNLQPLDNGIEYTRTPRITFNLLDKKSGIDHKDIILKINGEHQSVYYDELTGWGYAVSAANLDDGIHDLILKVKDRSGNMLDTVRQKFLVRGLIEPSDKDCFKISIIPDIHSSEYSRLAFTYAEKVQTDFVIQMGDLVDLATQEEYEAIKENLHLLGDKPILTIPGNHESFQGNLDLYTQYLGATASHLIYGNTLFVFLNTAYNQSISESDASQFQYLEELLEKNVQKNIVIITHVPTKDRFGTSHQMKQIDAELLECMLGNVKQRNPSYTITVLFGHLHVLDNWEVKGVNYLVTGNSAAKGYVSHEQGNILGHGILHITNDGINYKFIPFISSLCFKENQLAIEVKTLKKGDSFKPEVYGVINKLSSNYKVNLMNFDLIDKRWHSTSPSVINVSEKGVMYAATCGVADVVLNVSGIQETLKVIVLN